MTDTDTPTTSTVDDDTAKAAALADAEKAEAEKAEAEKLAADAAAKADAAKAKAAAARASKDPDRDLISRLAADIADNIGVRQAHFELLAERLAKTAGLKFRSTSEGRIYAKMAGIEGGSRTSQREALINWGNAARRTLNQLSA